MTAAPDAQIAFAPSLPSSLSVIHPSLPLPKVKISILLKEGSFVESQKWLDLVSNLWQGGPRVSRLDSRRNQS